MRRPLPPYVKHASIPKMEPGFVIQKLNAWLDRFAVNFPRPITVKVKNAEALEPTLQAIASNNDGVNFFKLGNALTLQFSSKYWLFEGRLIFSRTLNSAQKFQCTGSFQFNLMRFLAHSRGKKRFSKLSSTEQLTALNSKNVYLKKLKAGSLNNKDNHLLDVRDFRRIGMTRVEALELYLTNVEQVVTQIISTATGLSIPFRLRDWTLGQIEVMWEFEEEENHNAISRAFEVGTELQRLAMQSKSHYYTSEANEDTVTTIVPLAGKNVELTCYAKQSTRLRLEVKYHKQIRQRLGKRGTLEKFPNSEWLDIIPFIEEVVVDAHKRINKQIDAALPERWTRNPNPVVLFAFTLGKLARLGSGGEAAVTQITISLINKGVVSASNDRETNIVKQLVKQKILKRYSPRARNAEKQYVLRGAYKHVFDHLRKNLEK